MLSPEFIFESRPGAALPDNRTYGIFWMPYKELATAFDLYGAFNYLSLTLEPGAVGASRHRRAGPAADALWRARRLWARRSPVAHPGFG